MKLQILIPQYKETDEVAKPLLDSIAIQQGIDFNDIEVLICNDGTDVHLTPDLLGSYTFHIEYWQNEHGGVSATRNALLDMASADYIMFCDADDMFCSVCGLYQIMLDIANGFDALNSVFIEEACTKDGTLTYITHDNDSTFVHGKVYRRQYLIDNNIRWNNDLTIHEDSFFNVIALNMTTQVRMCKTPFYMWKYRAESVCRHDSKYMLKTFDKFLDSNDALVDEMIKRGAMDKAMYFCTHMVFDTYYTMNKPEWVNQENKEYREKTERRFAEYFLKHRSLWDAVPMADKTNVSATAREKNLKQGMLLEAVTVFDWLKGVEQCLQRNKEADSGRKNV